jgi:hypothetical protein
MSYREDFKGMWRIEETKVVEASKGIAIQGFSPNLPDRDRFEHDATWAELFFFTTRSSPFTSYFI